MLETKLKVAFLLAVLFLTSLPVIGILQGTSPTPKEDLVTGPGESSGLPAVSEHPLPQHRIQEEMILIPAGPFIQGTTVGGYDEQPERTLYVSAYSIDRFEVTNGPYQEFVTATGHRKPEPPSRYAKRLAHLRGLNQPAVYVSWHDADEYCRWRGKRLPTEAEWEKAMRGTDGRIWPWGNRNDPGAANFARVNDGFEVSAPAGSFKKDRSPFGVTDGAGNVMEWVADWYGERAYQDGAEKDPHGPEFGVFKGLRGGGYATTGNDVRITSRSKMVPDFRDDTIGFRCAISGEAGSTTEGSGNL